MFEMLRMIAIINAAKSLAGPWACFHHVGEGELDEDTAVRLPEGKVWLDAKKGEILASYKDGGKPHKLLGSVAFQNFSFRDIVKWDSRNVDKDDIYISSHLDDETDRRIIVEYRFSDQGVLHRFRFKKTVG